MVPPAPTPLTVSVWQGPAVSLDVPANVATCLQVVRDAAHQGAHILVFPELFLSGYCGAPVDMHRAALTVASVEMQAIGNAAKEGSIAVAVGYPERAADGRVFNSCAVWNCHGTLVRSYRKVCVLLPPGLLCSGGLQSRLHRYQCLCVQSAKS